jgi:NAD(P)-dependent dehydrogenase (short-subunit alcohol dehydrogenase family)
MNGETASAGSLLGLEGKVALVTGAGHGIGLATARLLARAGASVAVLDLNGESARAAAAELTEAGAHALVLEADTRSEAAVEGALKAALERFGRLDVGVCNVGGSAGAPIRSALETAEETWRAVLEQSLLSTVLCTRAFGRAMSGQGSGAIVNIASVAGLRGASNNVAYGAAKAGVISTLAVELAPLGIRVNLHRHPRREPGDLRQRRGDDPAGEGRPRGDRRPGAGAGL